MDLAIAAVINKESLARDGDARAQGPKHDGAKFQSTKATKRECISRGAFGETAVQEALVHSTADVTDTILRQ